MKYFPALDEFQQLATASLHTIGGRWPVGPDLWLTTRGKHRFIEVKLPGDRVGRHQLVGLALIATCLRSDRPVSVEIVHLHNGPKPHNSSELVQEFEVICEKLGNTKSRRTTGASTSRWSRRRVN